MSEIQELWNFILKAMWFIAPAGFATMVPVLVRPIFGFLAYPVDANYKINGEPLFGKNKTWRGVIFATLTGVVYFWFQKSLVDIPWFASISIINYKTTSLWFGFLMGLGAIVGDLIKSFFKRRFKIPPGVSWFPFDQIDYVIGALAFLAPLYFPGFRFSLGLLLVGIGLHLLSNVLGHVMKLRKDWI
jgi:CDP-2,3-bis-(O-geranylgeranyl)-sn-glycerol synthase